MATTRPLGPGYPVTLLLSGRPCLVVGGGAIAERKLGGLLAAGARVTVVAPSVRPGIRATGVEVRERPFAPGDVAGSWLVVTATGRPEVDRAVHEACEATGILVNAADEPAACSVLLPALLRRGCVTVAVSTGGRSPALAAALRDVLAEVVGPQVDDVAEALAAARDELHAAGRSTQGLAWRALAARLLAAAGGGGGREALDALVTGWLAAPLEPS